MLDSWPAAPAATDEVVEEAAIPFDRRRHGLIIGMGAAALVVERPKPLRERGIQPICEVLSTVTANSAFHGTRLDVQHIGQVMESLMSQAEAAQRHFASADRATHRVCFPRNLHSRTRRQRLRRDSRATACVRRCGGQIVIANTKGFTGHAMGTGIEDVVAVKALETGWCPRSPTLRK